MEKSSAARHFHEAGHSFSTLSFCVIKFLEVAEVVTLNRNVTIRKNIFFLENALFFLMKNYPSHVFIMCPPSSPRYLMPFSLHLFYLST